VERHDITNGAEPEVRHNGLAIDDDLIEAALEFAGGLERAGDAAEDAEIGLAEGVAAIEASKGPNVPELSISPGGLGLVSVAV
jgi:hypothetical protein